jgi:hypothetical protein
LWDESADDLILTNAGLAVGSDATGDVYYRDANGFLARLGASTDGYVLTTGGAGTIPAWEAAPGGGSGDFSGPGSSTDNAVLKFDGTGGKTGQNSGIIIDDSNNITGAANVTLSGELDAATGDFSGDVDIDGTLETDALTIGGTALLANDTNNRITTATGSGTLNGEANLTFDGSTLGVAGAVTITKNNDYGVSTYDGTNAGGTIGLGTLTADANGGWLLKNVYYDGSAWAVNNSSVGAGAMKFDASGNIVWLTQASGSGLPAEVMRIDSAGNVGIGTTAPTAQLNVEGPAGTGIVHISRNNTAGSFASATYHLARLGFGGEDSDSGEDNDASAIDTYTSQAWTSSAHGTYMVFRTTADDATAATERMRIGSNGHIAIGHTDTTIGVHADLSCSGNHIAKFVNSSATNPYGLRVDLTGATMDDNTRNFFVGSDATTTRIYIYSDGDLANHDGTYGTISDVKLKQDIVDVRSYWDDFKQLQYRKFRHISDVEADADAPYRLGLVAQEVETIFPALVPESPDPDIETEEAVVDADGEAVLDEDGNPTYETIFTPSGTTYKWVKSSIIEGPIMGSVVQELQTRLEAAEAKITALESA